MKSIENLLIQGLILSLTTQFVWTLVEPEAAASQPQGIVGALYRSAAMKNPSSAEKEGTDLNSGLSRGQRCVRCGTGYGGYGNYADRGNYYGREDPLYYGRDQYYGRDRNWYYQQESRSPYERYPYDRYNTYNRYDDRYYGRSNPYEYDSYNGNSNYYNSYRGNGYDNLNPAYYEAMRDRFQRERSYGYDQYGYDRYNDRPSYRGYYDNRNFKPYDESYSRGTAGFDYSGRGYYFANQNGIDHRPLPPPSHFDPQLPPNFRPNFYEQSQKPQPLPPSNNNPYYNNLPQSQHSPHTTPVIPPEYYQGKPAHSPSSSSSHTQTVSSNTIGVDSGSASANKNKNNNSNNELDNKEKVSTTYGGRPQSLGSSYLFERTDDEANPAGTGMNPPALTGDKKQESANMEMKKE
ncbi:hypothetical protein PVAND_008071 [Polypedilum vanderplanki]|uniref:Uncharacterized protein n=1 Tax=Polypedilum vanderplanki TaxID=319348 RepID=A0A9J6C8L4_POLVA|nr:hypothetical protein PVAND_008071 [Polypedilum vanderplanki]